jgi:hypothetical protein
MPERRICPGKPGSIDEGRDQFLRSHADIAAGGFQIREARRIVLAQNRHGVVLIGEIGNVIQCRGQVIDDALRLFFQIPGLHKGSARPRRPQSHRAALDGQGRRSRRRKPPRLNRQIGQGFRAIVDAFERDGAQRGGQQRYRSQAIKA